jgi:hypothetical protein
MAPVTTAAEESKAGGFQVIVQSSVLVIGGSGTVVTVTDNSPTT